jgi:UDPglucose 6-dehydrogenase
MNDNSVAIVGYGAVGRHLHVLFPDAVIHDPAVGYDDRAAVNRSRFAFVCVPTPSLPDGSADVSIVRDVVGWIEADVIVIRSTVSVGTSQALATDSGKRIVFQPEYGPGATPDHPFSDPRNIGWVVLGGEREATGWVADLYKTVANSNLNIQHTDATTAELVKYMENSFLAAKVAFCNEFYDIAAAAGVGYDELRELWLLDPRIGRSHTFVYPDDRGFGGPCLPKDLSAIVSTAEALGVEPTLLKSVEASNRRVRNAG